MRLCHRDEVLDRTSRGFDPQQIGQDTVLVVRWGAQLFAYRDACPHHNTPMAWRKDAYLSGDGLHIVCAAHGAQFDIATGLCTLGPCLGGTLTPVPLIFQNNGEVFVAPVPILDTSI